VLLALLVFLIAALLSRIGAGIAKTIINTNEATSGYTVITWSSEKDTH